jgi:arylsulfatase A-like enzyme
MQKPNVVFFLIDDMGWTDLSCLGSAFYETPNLDRLARQGMRFTDGYAACPVCSPTRASILAGKYPANVGVTDWIDWGGHLHPCRGRLVDVPYLKHLPLTETSIASALRDGGYQTWHVGKWHLGGPDHYPEKHGFDVNVGGCEMGCPSRGKNYFSPWDIPTLANGTDGEYLTDRLTDEAIRLIRARDGRPFFLNFWHYAVHTPIQAPAPLVEKFRAKAAALGLDRRDPFEEGEFHPGEHKKSVRVKRRLFHSDPVYAAMVYNLDWNIGRVLAALEETGAADNTVVIFTSDNGGLATSEGSPTSNAPLSEGKGWMYEGGTREPFLVKWPGVTPPASVCTVPVTSPDFYPTLLEIAGLPPRPEQHRDGTSLVPLLRGGDALDRAAIFWHYPHYGNQGGSPGSSVRRGDHKLIEFFEDGHVELYNVREDVGETRNLAPEQPELAAALQRELAAWRASVEAKIPRPNPDFQPWEGRGTGAHFPSGE